MSPENRILILIVEPEERRRGLVRAAFDQAGRPFDLRFVSNESLIREALRKEPADVIFSRAAGSRNDDGFVAACRTADRSPGLVLIVPGEDPGRIQAALNSGVDEWVPDDDAGIMRFPEAANRALLRAHSRSDFQGSDIGLQELGERLSSAHSLVVTGQLVPGVLHEINNALAATFAYAELLAVDPGTSAGGDVAKLLESANRCKTIVDHLAALASARPPAKSLESLHAIIDRAISLRAHAHRSRGIEIVRHYCPVSTVFADARQILQLVLHLLLNAEQAVAGSRVARISFSTTYHREDRKISLRISDTGSGIAPQVLPRIFDPFFTTKPVGLAIGLGLSASRQIAELHSGTIRVEQNEDEGTSVIVELPTGADAGTNG